MSRPGTFDRVYSAIKERLRQGRFRPGEKLEPANLSDELNASVTPVRDALHRLTGERVVEAPRHEGFRAPLLTETMLRHLYAWHEDILLLALARGRGRQPVAGEAAESPESDQRLVLAFARLAERGGNPEHLTALMNIADRLEPYRRFEREFLDGIEEESGEIFEAIEARDLRRMRRGLVRYHRRRQRIVPELLSRSHRS